MRWNRLLKRLTTISFVLLVALSIAGGAMSRAQAQEEPAASIARSIPRLQSGAVDARELAKQVTIRRDQWGVPHIEGPTDQSVVFGFAYAQCEDYFWQVEDTYILALGRYSEVYGVKGLNSDLLNHAFEIVSRSQADYGALDPESQSLCEAFVAGLNYYLDTHPETKPRLITRFEPWQILAFGRHLTLEMGFRYTRLSNNYLPRSNEPIYAATGSNAWAVGPSKTASGKAMLVVNPHQPWFGFGQMYEAHLKSGAGWNFSGATFFGNPMPTLGHNEHLGWAFTTNEPDIADVWRVTFDDPAHPLNYRYGDGYRTAEEWKDTIKVRTARGFDERAYTFRKTHYGPIVAKENEQQYLAAQIGKLYESVLLRQAIKMVRATNLDEFKAAMAMQQFPFMNAVYADTAGNIFYLYNGTVPKRDPQFDWSKPVDGSDPRTEWLGVHPLDELPQVLNPPSGYVQNCNSSPFTTTDIGNPDRRDYPDYMVEDKDDDKRRAKMARQMLSGMSDITFEQMEEAAFDTTVYWAQHEIPQYAQKFAELQDVDPALAKQVAPYMQLLTQWDCRIAADSAAATLCTAWYEELYGTNYPGETLKPQYVDHPEMQFKALAQAAAKLKSTYGDWRVPYAEIHRIQRKADVADLLELPFDDRRPSLSSLGGHGPMGVLFTQYYSPPVNVPLVKSLKKQYGLVGATYMGVYEFGDKIRSSTLIHFGESGDPSSPHFFDQAQLLSDRKLKPELFYWPDVLAGAVQTYHPGETQTIRR